ncbi:reverse transcriptase domain-containing protein [Methanoregula sp.]|uniref:reverse transcriptase domain-containing protein n=1 Tax=Methanoregula sp. TaxID=2052170 RepID=UPI00356675B1
MNSRQLVEVAYKKYKQYVYYEQLDLFQRKKIADFECDTRFDNKLDDLAKIVDLIKEGSDNIEQLNNFLNLVGYNLIPKSIGPIPCNKKRNSNDFDEKSVHFITNTRSAEKYRLDGINYFIDVPVELQLISVIWVMKAGIHIDSKLSDCCYWFRLNERLKKPNEKSSHIFKFYNNQYSEWRNNAIKKAEDILKKEKKDIAILSLDLKHCFYCIHPDFSALKKFLDEKNLTENDKIFAITLTKIIEKIHKAYQEEIEKDHFCYTHGHIKFESEKYVVPIGLVSSGIICNWHLSRFDEQITNELNPAYYGRYADDILIVISNPYNVKSENICNKEFVKNFIEKYFVTRGIFFERTQERKKYYCLTVDPNLCIQSDKLFLHFYSANDSLAMLDAFKEKLTENSSAFYLLPEKEMEFYINNSAYSLHFEGSTNKFRSITGITENITELSIKLSKINHVLMQSEVKQETLEEISDQIFKFYKGSNFINFCRTWEKYFTFTVLSRRHQDCAKFYFKIQDAIKRISDFKPDIGYNPDASKALLKRQKADLQKYLDISISMSVSLLGSSIELYFKKHIEEGTHNCKSPRSLNQDVFNITSISFTLRKSNLIRHYNVAYPLVNYTDYENSLIDIEEIIKYLSKEQILLSKKDNKIKFSPRFIHFDEFYLFWFIQNIYGKNSSKISDIIPHYLNLSTIGEFQLPITIEKILCIPELPGKEKECNDKNQKISAYHIHIPRNISTINNEKTTLRIGIANIKIKKEDVESSYLPRRKQNVSLKRREELNKILNLAIIEKCDLLVLPELAVPPQWLSLMVDFARRHQLGLIFGMEYLIDKENEIAYNNVVAALPIINDKKYRTCCPIIRCKNHYAPGEIIDLTRAGRLIPIINPYIYYLIKWRNSQFSIYNCYELADITHRSIFKSDLDFLVACVLNRDIAYFSSIVESVVKDLHCFVVQVNCSEYGDSRIVQPTESRRMNIIRVTGGENSTILTTDLDIENLRDFQSLDYSETDDRFKPTPPGFNHSKPRMR